MAPHRRRSLGTGEDRPQASETGRGEGCRARGAMIDLRLGDCLERMGEIPEGSIDLVLADLPYGTTQCRWDQIIPFGLLWAHYRRLLAPPGAVVLTASQPFTSMLVMSNPDWFRY